MKNCVFSGIIGLLDESENLNFEVFMKKTRFDNVNPPYSLHDMNVIAFVVDGDTITMKTQSGMVRTTNPSAQVDGYVEFHDVDFDFCYAYVYEDFYGNVGSFSGRKMFLKDFISDFENASFSVMDENYGFNRTCYTGYLSKGGTIGECSIEIYHLGEMVFCEQVDEDKRSMKEVILSADGNLCLYSVPADVADNLDKVCNEFANQYIWHGPNNAKFLKCYGKQYVACYGVEDFIEYLNIELYPQAKSVKIKTVGSFDSFVGGVPEEYRHIPWFNF